MVTAHEIIKIITKTNIAFVILDSSKIVSGYFNPGLLKNLLVSFNKKPRNNPKNKKTIIYLGFIV
jgi:hypothetical protein